MTIKVGVIGTGMLGYAICTRLLKCKFKLTVYNRTRTKALNLTNQGAILAKTPKNVALNSEIILTVVKDSSAINEIAFGKNGIIDGNHEDLTIADISTINPIDSIKIKEKFSKYNIYMLDAPVMGGPKAAINGELILMVSGKKTIYEKYKNIFKHIAKQTFYLGKYGIAHLIKLSMNMQIAFLATSISEGIILAKRASIDPRQFLEILNATYFKTGMSKNKAYKMIANDFKPTFMLKNLRKDLDITTAVARSLGVNLPITRRINEIYKNADRKGLGELDYTGIFAYLSKISNNSNKS